MAVDPVAIEGEEGAISMDADPVAATNNMSYVVECASFQPPRVQLDETGPHTPMTQITPPDGSGMPGVYRDTVTFTSEGDHVIICFNSITRVRERVFAGDPPVWDPSKVADNTFAGRRANVAAQTAATLGVTSKLG